MVNLWSCHQEQRAGWPQDSSACSSLLFCPVMFFFLDLSVPDCTSCPGLHTPCIPNLQQVTLTWSHMSNPQVLKPLLHIPALYTLGSWSTWSVTHWAAATAEGDLSSRCCSAGFCDTGHVGEGKRGQRGEKARHPSSTSLVLCSARETWLLLPAWLYRDWVWWWRYCRKTQESHESPFTLCMWPVLLGVALAFNEIRW